jgi:hypothetical protein
MKQSILYINHPQSEKLVATTNSLSIKGNNQYLGCLKFRQQFLIDNVIFGVLRLFPVKLQ